MPYTEVMSKWKAGKLHSGSPSGPKVKSQKQAVAIMLSEKRAAAAGKKEYQPTKKYDRGGTVDPDARAAPYSEDWGKTPFPQPDPDEVAPALKELSPKFSKEKERDKVPEPDKPSHTVAVAKGGAVKKFNKGGHVEHSSEDAFKNNLMEAVAGSSRKIGLKKGGPVPHEHRVEPAKRKGWKRWGTPLP